MSLGRPSGSSSHAQPSLFDVLLAYTNREKIKHELKPIMPLPGMATFGEILERPGSCCSYLTVHGYVAQKHLSGLSSALAGLRKEGCTTPCYLPVGVRYSLAMSLTNSIDAFMDGTCTRAPRQIWYVRADGKAPLDFRDVSASSRAELNPGNLPQSTFCQIFAAPGVNPQLSLVPPLLDYKQSWSFDEPMEVCQACIWSKDSCVEEL